MQKRFRQAGLSSDGLPVTAHGLRRGAIDLAEAGGTVAEIEAAGRWTTGSPIRQRDRTRPIGEKARGPFTRVPVGGRQNRAAV
ncbi:site-specific integrase [Streptomyces mangrovi]|uniref:hypothetical protein n=1 Tax=Streptomyces mangrovi TaxID=1206892 RepID=UPI00399C9F1B